MKRATMNYLLSENENLFTVEPLCTDTSLKRTVSYVPTKFSYISSKKKNLFNADPL